MNKKKYKKLMELRYRNHQETKQNRLEELNQKMETKEITDSFRHASICNSIFSKKRILSRKRIILRKEKN